MVCDFKTVFGIFHSQVKQTKLKIKTKLFRAMFCTYSENNYPYEFYRSEVSNCTNGVIPIPQRIVDYYSDNKSSLKSDITDIINDYVFDKQFLFDNFRELLMGDFSVPEDVKRNVINMDNDYDLVTETLFISISRPYKTEGRECSVQIIPEKKSAMVVSSFINCEPPEPCDYFCGRDEELDELHQLLNEHKHIFIQGIGGIGKSELIKAYAQIHKNDYTNILFFTYNHSLMETIADIDSTSDFDTNNKFLRSLKEDSLLIIDNFNVTETEEELLSVFLKYKCKIIFTTRCIFECGSTYELNEIQNENDLVELFSKHYSDTESNHDIVVEIIRTLHSHTFVVELIARLLECGLLSPKNVLKKLKKSSVTSDFKDKIKAKKDDVSSKATYHNHINFIYNLLDLSAEKKNIMMALGFTTPYEIDVRFFAKLADLETANELNDLIETGMIHKNKNMISLHPLINDIVFEDLQPSITGCEAFLNSVNCICLRRDSINANYRMVFNICENISQKIIPDDLHRFITILNDAVSFMDDMNYALGMERILDRLSEFTKDMSQSEMAVYYSHLSGLAFMNGNVYDCEMYLKKALQTCPPDYDYMVSANLYFSAGNFYNLTGDKDKARNYMEQGMKFLSLADDGKAVLFDKFNMRLSYALILSESAQPDEAEKAIRLLKGGISEMEKIGLENSTFYADHIYYLAGIYYNQQNSEAGKYLKQALDIHKELHDISPELFDERLNEISNILGTLPHYLE